LQADRTSLQADIKKYLVGDSLRFALFLIGGDRETEARAMEMEVVSLSEAKRLAKVASLQTFVRDGGLRVPVPYQEADDGCTSRTHIIAQAFKELGYASEKIFAHSLRFNKRGEKVADLHLRTDFAHDSSTPSTVGHKSPASSREGSLAEGEGKSGGLSVRGSTSDTPTSTWEYHTACCIWVRTRSGAIERRVVDPALDPDKPDRLWTVEEWMEKLDKGPGSYNFITFKEWQRRVEKEWKKYPNASVTALDRCPADQTYVFTASRNYIDIPRPDIIKYALNLKDIPDQYSNLKYNDDHRKLIGEATKWVPFCRIAREIRKKMREKTIRGDEDAKKIFKGHYRNFWSKSKRISFVRRKHRL